MSSVVFYRGLEDEDAEALNNRGHRSAGHRARARHSAGVFDHEPAGGEPAAGRSSKRVAAWVLAGLLLVVAVVGLAKWWQAAQARAAEAAVHHAPSIKTVTVDRPARVASSSIVLPATVRPWQGARLYARVSGYLSAWHKDLGEQVRAGEVLAEIETPELDRELAQAEALAREAEAAAVQARVEQQEAIADLQVAQAQLARAKADSELAASLVVRREKLMVMHAVSQEELETHQKQAEARSADLRAAESDLVRRRTNLSTRDAIISSREATAKSRQANVERLKELQAFKHIVAPFDGVITRRTAETGMLVTAGSDALFAVEDMNRVRVQAAVPQAYSAEATPGIAATVRVPEQGSRVATGTITRIARSVEAASRTMLAEVELDNASGQFQPGSYAKMTIDVHSGASSWTIPANTLQMRVEGPHVVVVDGQNLLDVRPVSLGRDLGNRVVVDGIHGDERLVVNPTDDLVSGLHVEVRAAADPVSIVRR
ncbi:MAG TPA: efflux RND transporter periplasmic adaptor subunit [Pirellulales bacterium]|jgi:multidrug efflux pump subunit AcrA (membrane-fusion protein)|nr:efflux RND transporter periplasmic adaptor subunit [Pirellulales bacterium]